jgi:hypothetical protein
MRVGRMVRHLLGGCSGFVHGSRLKLFVRMVEAVLRGRRLTPATVGRNVKGPLPKHGIKCMDRFLGNNGLWRQRDRLFRALAARVLAGCSQPVILVDWTETMAAKHEVLVAATPIGGRALPLYVEVHPLKKLGNAEVEANFLRALFEVLPAGCKPIVVSDAGFKGPFFDVVVAQGWDFLGRIRGTAKALTSDGEVVTKDELYARATVSPRDLGRFRLFVGAPRSCRLVLIKKRQKPGPKRPPTRCKEEQELRQAALDPWLLATSVDSGDAAYIVSLYARRMQIEETFRDAKNHRFGWCLSDARTSTHQRTLMLLLLAAFAMSIAILIGLSAEAAGAQRAYQANTTSNQRVLSCLVLACAMLHRGDFRFVSLAHLRAALRLTGALARA